MHDTDARTVHEKAEAANTAAAHCWTALLAGCDGPGRWELVDRLRELSEATSAYAGTRWWLTDGAVHRRRVAEAEGRIEEAIREGDGAEFAEAFAGYDQAVATAVVCVHSRLGSSTT
ncbi:sugar ABC transporter substrate-binding protein [Goodfellowiella coeruleoviolacea]|uniref:sugar ABC transporter substrate-binding protein n=1 Tax=Goodfellowiella coeruleoviolacea TaxID=334858 RepID=UPI000AC0B08B|nr:sugar ABC transporter substrate-binding protein [Goodfellowiella coeruleoviolacea]